MSADGFSVRTLALPVYLPNFLFAIGQGAAIPILPLLALDMGLSVPVAGLLVALRSVGNLLFDIPAGMLVSRLGERNAMLIGSVLLGGVAVGIGARPPLWLLMILVMMMGQPGRSGCWPVWRMPPR